VKLWDVKTGVELMTLQAATPVCKAVCFSPDGQTLAAASTGGTIKIWAVKSQAKSNPPNGK
jgi:WD40 repeat protein